jgi:DNA-binding transcriptional regulator YiaG
MVLKTGSKYRPLFEDLSQSGQDQVALSFAEIESRLGDKLPASARLNRAWWSNRKGTLPASAWMEAGYQVVDVNLAGERVTFQKPARRYEIRREGDIILWDSSLVKALRTHMDLNQTQFAGELGIRQQTVSEWENGIYAPSRAMCKYLSLIAERAGFTYGDSPSTGEGFTTGGEASTTDEGA